MGQVTQVWVAIEAYIDRSRKAKAHLKMNMAREAKGNKNNF